MSLKTDYKDDVFDGTRKYRPVLNDDGTYSYIDVTDYSQEGDLFGANNINETNEAVNKLNHVASITLTASGWTGSAAPYTQTVSVAGATSEDDPVLVSMLASDASVDTQKAYIKAFGIIASGSGVTGDGSITFKVYKKPTIDIVIGLKGV